MDRFSRLRKTPTCIAAASSLAQLSVILFAPRESAWILWFRCSAPAMWQTPSEDSAQESRRTRTMRGHEVRTVATAFPPDPPAGEEKGESEQGVKGRRRDEQGGEEGEGREGL